ncbi:hypothetical protein C8Q70DRAFT_1018688 [Cubamyces menziesii]|nr:hypothetical protein C8Q70DRAFT_1018688 [Cubamyces menziesii]
MIARVVVHSEGSLHQLNSTLLNDGNFGQVVAAPSFLSSQLKTRKICRAGLLATRNEDLSALLSSSVQYLRQLICL